MASTAKFFGVPATAGLIAAAMLTLSAPAWAGGGISANDLPDPGGGTLTPSRAAAPTLASVPSAHLGAHGVARPDGDRKRAIESCGAEPRATTMSPSCLPARHAAEGDPGGDGA
jgi:hypothetical protein